jgi:hypothetical protein
MGKEGGAAGPACTGAGFDLPLQVVRMQVDCARQQDVAAQVHGTRGVTAAGLHVGDERAVKHDRTGKYRLWEEKGGIGENEGHKSLARLRGRALPPRSR